MWLLSSGMVSKSRLAPSHPCPAWGCARLGARVRSPWASSDEGCVLLSGPGPSSSPWSFPGRKVVGFFFFPGEVLSLPQDHSSALLVLTSLRQTSAPPSRFPCSSTAMFIPEVGRGPSEGGSPFSTSKQRGFTLFHPKTKGVHPLPPPPKWRAQPCAWGRSLQPAPARDKNWF